MKIYYLTLFILIFNICLGQEIPSESYVFKKFNILYDFGENWTTKSNISSNRFKISKHDKSILDTIIIKNRIGYFLSEKGKSLSQFSRIIYKGNFYIYLSSKLVSDSSMFINYTGIPRDKSRFGFNSGEIDLSGIGYENNNIILQYGRGKQSIGTGGELNLVLNENSVSYDYGLFGMNYRNIRFRYFHGFLERNNLNNRYITAKSIEYSNKKNIIFSLSEIIIYSGINRPFDISYLNPISSHLEVELNNRQNALGLSNANAIWQISKDLMLNKNIRLSNNIFIDELVIDKIERDANKNHGLAYSSRLSFSSSKYKTLFTMYSLYSYVGENTLRHSNGMNNFVSRNKLIGSNNGSDMQSIKIGVDVISFKNNLFSTSFEYSQIGENTILNNKYDPYHNYLKGEFPSGNYLEFYKLNFETSFQIKKNTIIHNKVLFIDTDGDGYKAHFNVYLNIFYES